MPLASTKPQVNADEILATLDADTRNYLTLLLQGGAEGLGGEEKGLQAVRRPAQARADDPRHRPHQHGAGDPRGATSPGVIHNFGLLAEELGRHDQQLAAFVDSSNAVFDSFARQQASIRASLQELPSTLRGDQPGLGERRPPLDHDAARAAGPDPVGGGAEAGPGGDAAAVHATRRRRSATRSGPSRARSGRRSSIWRRARSRSNKTVNGLKTGLASLNYGLNELAYNPNSSVGNYLFYLGWLNHNLNSVYLNQDAYGPLRRGLIIAQLPDRDLRASRSRRRIRSCARSSS